jgi:antitoxin Phd
LVEGLPSSDEIGQIGYNSQYSEINLVAILTFRNSQGELVELLSVPATRFKNQFGNVVDQAVRGGAVAITKHDAPRAVLLSYAEFASLIQSRGEVLEELNAQFDDLLARMQTPEARQGMQRAFDATPARLGRAAMKAATKSKKKT